MIRLNSPSPSSNRDYQIQEFNFIEDFLQLVRPYLAHTDAGIGAFSILRFKSFLWESFQVAKSGAVPAFSGSKRAVPVCSKGTVEVIDAHELRTKRKNAIDRKTLRPAALGYCFQDNFLEYFSNVEHFSKGERRTAELLQSVTFTIFRFLLMKLLILLERLISIIFFTIFYPISRAEKSQLLRLFSVIILVFGKILVTRFSRMAIISGGSIVSSILNALLHLKKLRAASCISERDHSIFITYQWVVTIPIFGNHTHERLWFVTRWKSSRLHNQQAREWLVYRFVKTLSRELFIRKSTRIRMGWHHFQR